MEDILKATMVGVLYNYTGNSLDKAVSSRPSRFLLGRSYLDGADIKVEYKLVTYAQLATVMSANAINVTNLRYNKKYDSITLKTGKAEYMDDYRRYPCYNNSMRKLDDHHNLTSGLIMLGETLFEQADGSQSQTSVVCYLVPWLLTEDMQYIVDKNTVITTPSKIEQQFSGIRIYNGSLIHERDKPRLSCSGISMSKVVGSAKNINTPVVKDNQCKVIERFMTIEEFYSLCEYHKLDGFLNERDSNISIKSLDTRCKDLYLPINLDSLELIGLSNGNHYIETDSDRYNTILNAKYSLERILVPAKIRLYCASFNDKFYELAPNFRALVFEDGTEIVDANAVKGAPRKIDIIIPNTANKLINYNPSILDIDLRQHPSIKEITNSFSNCILDSNFNLGLAEIITSCFSGITNDVNITIPSTVVDFSGLSKLTLASITFEKGSKLKKIGSNSFSNIRSTFNEIDIPEGVEEIGSSCFINWPELTRINLPSTLRKIGYRCFEGTGIKEIDIPESVTSLVDLELTDLKINLKHKTEIPSALLYKSKFKEVHIEDTVKIIDRGVFDNASLKFNIPQSLEEIGERAFRVFNTAKGNEILDFSETQLKIIGDQAFELSKFKGIILPDTVEEIGKRSFRQMFSLKWIYLPASITKIGLSALQGTFDTTDIRYVYTYRGCLVDTYCKRNKIKVKYVTSIDDVYNDLGMDAVGQRKLSKLRMILSGDPLHSELFDSKYDGNVLKFHSIYTTCKQVLNHITPLDKEKFVKSGMDIKQLIPSDRHDRLDSPEFKAYAPNLSQMNSYINMLMTFTTCNSELLNSDISHRFYNERVIDSVFNLAIFNNSSVILVKVSKREYENYVLYIVDDGMVVWSSLLRYSERSDICEITGISPEMHGKIDEKLDTNFVCPVNSSLSSSMMPKYIGKELKNVINEQITILAIDFKGDIPVSYGFYDAYLYSTVSGNVIKAGVTISNKDEISMKSISTFVFKELCPLHEIPKDWAKKIKEITFNQSDAERILKECTQGKKYIQKLCLSDGAYDASVPCYEWNLSDALQQLEIDSPKFINKNALDLILKSCYFKSGTRKVGKLDNIVEKHGIEIVEIENRYKVISYILKTPRKLKKDFSIAFGSSLTHLIRVEDITDASEKSTERVWFSCFSFKQGYKTIYKLVDKTSNSHTLLDNQTVSIDDFEGVGVSTYLDCLGVKKRTSIKLMLGINKCSGVVFLLGERNYVDNTGKNKADWYKLFRYRSLDEALKECSWIHYLHDSSPLKDQMIENYNIGDLIESIATGKTDWHGNRLVEIRNAILNGAPNGFDTGLRCQKFYDGLAKQPKGR